eukprot:CAMPEP_0167826676 /NCGR_PEP_ID=MMETSP0112_2-20121227/10187_1 /TAXON_ID=91324 /ORGANISM="Lotharella globosa, Strain CCCM811" /LENGTH=197 /DNA_ID=CAMNT_0007729187 /DNA_START=35 /DNA_END=625 /DNA_ORIENTATION=-
MAGGFKIAMVLPILVGLYMKNTVDTENEENILYARTFFVIGKIIELILYATLYYRISSQKREKTVEVSEKDMQPPNPLASMLGIDEDDDSVEKEKLTHTEYDKRVLAGEFKQTLLQTCIISMIHARWGVLIPMVVSVLMALVNKPDNALVRIYLFGEKESADLKRPFKSKSGFADMMAPKKTKKKKDKGKGSKKARG